MKLARFFLDGLKGSKYHKSCLSSESPNFFKSAEPDSVARIFFKQEAAAVTTLTLSNREKKS